MRKYLRLALANAAVRAKSSKALYDLYSDALNAGEFSNLYEHEKMLADSVRVDSYAAGIRRYVEPDDVVVDVGTGTGILAILAARQGANVYAIDHSEFIEVARQVAEGNGIYGIDFRRVNSRDFTPPETVDVLLHEVIGDDLFDEDMVDVLLDVKRRALGHEGTILPSKFELFIEPVMLNEEHRVPFIGEMEVRGIDFGLLCDHPDVEKYKPPGYSQRSVKADEIATFLSTPRPMLSFDLNELVAPESVPSDLDASRRVVTAGRMDGFCLFFRVTFDDEIRFVTAPDRTATSWGNRLFRTRGTEYDEGDVISYTVSADDITDAETWSISLT